MKGFKPLICAGFTVTSRLLAVLLMAVFAVAGCSSDGGGPKLKPGEKIAPIAEQSRDSGTNYRLGVGDRV